MAWETIFMQIYINIFFSLMGKPKMFGCLFLNYFYSLTGNYTHGDENLVSI